MKKLLTLLLTITFACTSCTALPAEERAFAVALMVEKAGETWRVHGRIPTYQTGGGYLTVTGEGADLSAALSAMDAAAPMQLHLSQLRLLVLHASLDDDISAALQTLSDRVDMRQHCAVAVMEDSAKAVMEALQPSTGARLSKAIDVLLESRIEQGAILSASLADVVRMGERQSPVLIALSVAEGKINLSGGYPVTSEFRLAKPLSARETALLSLLRGDAKNLRLPLDDGSAQVRDVTAKVRLSEDMRFASVELTLLATESTLTPDGLEQALASEILALLARMSREGCDVLGLGRKAILYSPDMARWHVLDWPALYRDVRWTVSVGVTGPA